MRKCLGVVTSFALLSLACGQPAYSCEDNDYHNLSIGQVSETLENIKQQIKEFDLEIASLNTKLKPLQEKRVSLEKEWFRLNRGEEPSDNHGCSKEERMEQIYVKILALNEEDQPIEDELDKIIKQKRGFEEKQHEFEEVFVGKYEELGNQPENGIIQKDVYMDQYGYLKNEVTSRQLVVVPYMDRDWDHMADQLED
jgi:chromosome segregation ATPase